MESFVPDNFKVPELFETDRIRLRMLSVDDAELDYEAVMSSIDHLQLNRPFGPTSEWPSSNLTLEKDEKDLAWHEKEFKQRTSFAYTVMNPGESKCLGCVYIYPSPNPEYDTQVMFWVREDELANGLDEHLFETVQKWIEEEWPFEYPGYPGRTIEWEKWKWL